MSNSKPFFAGLQQGASYQVHVFRSENHYIAYKSVHRSKNLLPITQCYGNKLRGNPDHRHETDPRVESLEATLDGEITAADHLPVNAQGETPTGERPPATLVARVDKGRAQKPYTLGGVTKWLSVDQPIGIRHATEIVPARVITLGPDYIEAAIDNGRAYRKPVTRKIDMTTTGVGLTFDKVIVTAA